MKGRHLNEWTGGSIVERLDNKKTKREGTVRLYKPAMTFFARIPDIDPDMQNRGRPYFESKDGREVRDWLETQLATTEKANLLKWRPVISIKHSVETDDHRRYRTDQTQDYREQVGIEIVLDRFYVALTADKSQWLSLPWFQLDPESTGCLAEEDRISNARNYKPGPKAEKSTRFFNEKPFSLPFIDGTHSWMEYTPELWAGLQEIVATIKRSGETLRELLGTKKGLAALIEVGAGSKRLIAGAMHTEEVVVTDAVVDVSTGRHMRLNLFDYRLSAQIAARDEPVAALIAAAMRRADTDNYEKLARVFPLVAHDLADRYNAPGGLLPGETAPK